MTAVTDQPIGRRVAYWRGRRRMSQQVFADRLGKSKSWVDKVERGVRSLDKFSTVHAIADVLQLDVKLLLGHDTPGADAPSASDRGEAEEIRVALEHYGSLDAYFTPTADPHPPVHELAKAVDHAWLTLQHGHYPRLAKALPRLLVAASAALDDRADVPLATRTYIQAHLVAAAVLQKLGEHELSWVAADRAMVAAGRAGDLLLTGVGAVHVSAALLGLGRARPALEIGINIAHLLAPTGASPCPRQLSVHGALLLQGALAAARLGDSATVRDLLAGADDAARALGGDHNYYWTCFGPTNVTLYRVAAAVELGDGRVAIKVHEDLDPIAFAAMPPERRAHHLFTVARGYAQVGDVDSAGDMLVAADRLAPAEVRCRPVAREVLGDVVRQVLGTPPIQLVELAEQVGVSV